MSTLRPDVDSLTVTVPVWTVDQVAMVNTRRVPATLERRLTVLRSVEPR